MSRLQRRTRLLARVGCAAGVAVAASLLAPPPAAVAATEPSRLMLVLDSSGSMAEPIAGGGTKIAAAKESLHTVIDELPSEAEVGLRVYGSEVFSRSDPGACTDSERVVDLGADNRDELRAAVDRYEPYGETPIGHALRQAGTDLGADGKRSIVLVSDGEPTCPPDPCRVARQLSKQGVELRVDVIGLDVSGQARRSLQCIATGGGGTYYDADSAEDLTDALSQLATRAARPYRPAGEEVTGTADAASAPTLTAGSYVDELGAPETDTAVRHYAVERSRPGSSLTVTASILTPSYAGGGRPTSEADGLELTLSDADGSRCGIDVPATARGRDATMVTASVDAEDCPDADRLLVRVDRAGSQDVTTPVELVVLEEPPVTDVDALPTPVDGDVAWQAPSGRPGATVVGGRSFASATPLAPGGFRGTVVPHEVQIFSVDVDWGQQLAATMSVPDPSGRLADELHAHGSPFALTIYGPGRAAAGAVADGAPDDRSDLYPSGGGEVGEITVPVTYRNREAIEDPRRAAATAGTYTIVVSLTDSRARTSYEVPFVLRVGVTGDRQPPPEYVTAAPSPSATPSTPAAEGDAGDAGAEPQADERAADADDSGVPTAVVAAGGTVLVVLLLGVAGWWMVRRSRAQK